MGKRHLDKLEKLPGVLLLPASNGFRADNFENSAKREVKIGTIGDRFDRIFISGQGDQKEVPVETPEATLIAYKMKVSFVDLSVLDALGGNAKVAFDLGQFWEILRIPHDDVCNKDVRGLLRYDGWINILFVRDVEGTAHMVACSWSKQGWLIAAPPPSNMDSWIAGRRVLCRQK